MSIPVVGDLWPPPLSMTTNTAKLSRKLPKEPSSDDEKGLKQSRHAGGLQPTLGICYGRARTINNGRYLRVAGQNFWLLLSGDSDLYASIIEPLGFDAQKYEEAFKEEKSNSLNRMTLEFIQVFCNEAGAIDWSKLVASVSGNLVR